MSNGLDEFDYEYYKTYEEPLDVNHNLKIYSPAELHHIAVLNKRMKYLQDKDKEIKTGLLPGMYNELKALEWVLALIEEIDNE